MTIVTVESPGVTVHLSQPFDAEQFEKVVNRLSDIEEVEQVRQIERISEKKYANTWVGKWEAELGKYHNANEVRTAINSHIIHRRKTPDMSAHCHKVDRRKVQVTIEQVTDAGL